MAESLEKRIRGRRNDGTSIFEQNKKELDNEFKS